VADRSSRTSRWIRGLLGREAGEPPKFAGASGPRRTCSGLRGIIDTEALTGEAICHALDEPVVANGSVSVSRHADAGAALAAAYGMALTGRRVSCLVSARSTGRIADRLREIAERHVPLVVFVITENSRDVEGLVATGAAVAVARDGMHALDLALVARRLAETTLTPVAVVLEGPEIAWAVGNLQLPPEALVREYLGLPGDEITCPTAAQQMLFGEHRRRVPRWFDLERPTAHGQMLPAPENAAAAEGRHTFFEATLAPALTEAIESFGALTGRDAGVVTRHALGEGKQAFVAQGSAVEVARTVSEDLRARDRVRVGVLGLNWRVPFAVDKIVSALSKAETVTVLERGLGPTTPLAFAIRGAAAGDSRRWVTAAYDRLGASGLRSACRNMQAGEEILPAIHLGIRPPSIESDFPKRQVLLHRMRREYPELERRTLSENDPLDVRPAGARTITLYVEREQMPESEAQQVIEALAEDLGSHIRSRVRPIERGLWELTLSFSREPFGDPGDDVPTDLMLIADFDHTIVENPLLRMARNGSVLIATDLEAAASSAVLPASWRDAIGGLGLGLFRVERGGAEGDRLEALVRAAVALVREQHDELERVVWDELTEGDRVAGETALPLAVRRFGEAGETYDNVARFWGELAEPRTHETARAAVPDPYLASGSVPACTSTFHDATSGRETFPTIDAARCTGCGKCWTACPDSAIGPVALGTVALLDAAADMAEAGSGEAVQEVAAKLRRAHKQLAAKIDGSLARSEDGVLGGQIVREAFDWLVEKMGVVADERTEMAQAFEATLEHLEAMPLSVTAPFFREPHAEQKGSGQLLMLAVNPRACQGCGVCSAVCPDGAVRRDLQAPRAVQRMRELWRVWEELPDTAGTTISRVEEHPDVGPLAAVLLSRHCLLSVTGGDGAEPGSGERIATRQVAAVVEYQKQRRVLSHVEELAALEERLREAIRTGLAEAVSVENLGHLDDALRRLRSEHAAGTELLDRLSELGERTDVDVPRVQRLVSLARGVERTRRSLTEGAHGVGRARYGVVLANGVASDWAGLFPRNPFSVPMTVDLGADGADVAAGLIESLLAERVETSRLIRRAELWLENPSDLRAGDRELDALTPGELTADELELCPPILVLAGGDALTRPAQAGLSRLLTSGLPVKVVLFDEHDLLSREAEPAMLALAHRRAFVLSTSIAHPRHLFEGVSEALSFPGPALIHLHAPSPRRHGFATDATVERAAGAVECRVHPLLRYDPSAEGFFGLRISLEGNPSVVDTWAVDGDGGAQTPLRWAEGETRFKDSTLLSDARGSAQPTVPGPNGRGLALGEILDRASATRIEIWATLQELAGVTTPFTETVRSRAEEELRQEREGELAALKAEYEAKLQARHDEQLTAQADRLRRRLLQLAGYGEGTAS